MKRKKRSGMWQNINRRHKEERRIFKKKVKIKEKKQKIVKEKIEKFTKRYMRMIKVCYCRYEEKL